MNFIYKKLLQKISKNIISEKDDIWNNGWNKKYNIFLNSDSDNKYYRILSIDNNLVVYNAIIDNKPSDKNQSMDINEIDYYTIKCIVRHGTDRFYSLTGFLLFDLIDRYGWITNIKSLFSKIKFDRKQNVKFPIKTAPPDPKHKETIFWAKLAFFTALILGILSVAASAGGIKTDCSIVFFHKGGLIVCSTSDPK